MKKPIQLAIAALICTFLISGCADSTGTQSTTESNQANSDDPTLPAGNGTDNINNNTTGQSVSDQTNTGSSAGAESDIESESDSEANQQSDLSTDTPTATNSNTTRVSFNITVPIIVSNALQVRLTWGPKDIAASWVADESWAIVDDFATNTEQPLFVTFYDDNGAITLGRAEINFRTGTNATQSVEITANQFNTDLWDADEDGISNLDELNAGTNPLAPFTIEPVAADLEIVADKTFRLSWQASAGAEFYRVLENSDGLSGFSQISGDINSSTLTFDHRVALYKSINARYIIQACDAYNCVDSTELFAAGSLNDAIGYVKASNTRAGNHFGGEREGNGVSLSADGNTLAVGAPGDDSNATGVNGNQNDTSAGDSGAVYVFTRVNARWQQQAYVKASNTDKLDNFGAAIGLSADGNTLAVGSPAEDSSATVVNGHQNDSPSINSQPPEGLDSGAIYVFQRTNGTWSQQAYLKVKNADNRLNLGEQISLSGDGNTIAAGVIGESSAASGVNATLNEDDDAVAGSGAAYVFARSNGNWQQQAHIKAAQPDKSDWFGWSVSLNSDGNILAIGAPGESGVLPGINGNQYDNSSNSTGALYIFSRSNGNWTQQTYIKASNPTAGDDFGRATSISADGKTLAVGAPGEGSSATGINGDQRDNSVQSSGAVYVFTSIDDTWQQEAYVKASNTGSTDYFGVAVSLSSDGDTLAVASIWEDSSSTGINGDQSNNSADVAGAAYVFGRSNSAWQQQAYVKASNTDADDRFGASLALSADGDTLAISASWEDSSSTGINGEQSNNSAAASGAVYLY